MSSGATREIRVLAVDPSTRGFGFAVLEDRDRLIDWGVKETRTNKNQASLKLVQELIERYEPDTIVTEDYTRKGSRRCWRVQELINRIQKAAPKQKIRTRSVSHSEVNLAFVAYGAVTKYQIASAIAKEFSELAPRLPPIRKPWMPEDYRMAIFDAVALGLAFFHIENKKKKAA